MAKSISPSDDALILTAEGRTALRSAISGHPDVKKFIKSGSEIARMKKVELFELARKLGIDVKSTITVSPKDINIGTSAEKTGMFADPAFAGVVEFDMEISMVGVSLKRKARVNYTNTPAWPHFDVVTGEEVLGWEQSSVGIEVLAVPDTDSWDSDGRGKIRKRSKKPTWVQIELWDDGILSKEIWESIDLLIDEDCRRQNVERLAAAAAQRH